MDKQYKEILSAISEVAEGKSLSEILYLKEIINEYIDRLYDETLYDILYTEDEDEPWWNR